MKSLTNVSVAAGYTEGLTLEARRFVRLIISVTAAPIFYQLGHGYPPSYDSPELFLQPGAVYALERECTGIRVRSGSTTPTQPDPGGFDQTAQPIASALAVVSIEAVEPWDVPDG